MKMFDVFNPCSAVETDVKVLFAVSAEYDDGATPHEMAHKAIACHDELLTALQRIVNAYDTPNASLAAPISAARNALDKANGK